jgi:hypothetical protein
VLPTAQAEDTGNQLAVFTVSYDLYFHCRESQGISQDAFKAYFGSRVNYGYDGDPGWYANEDTGVYFGFRFADGRNGDEDGGGQRAAAATFNINYIRPHIFGLEAEPELAAFVRLFDLTVEDTQLNGMGEGEYSREGFLAGWNAGNDIGYRAMADRAGASFADHVLPTERIEACWRWNIARRDLQRRLGDEMFVPVIMFVAINGRALSACVWPDGIPTALPRVDLLIIDRDELAPRRFFSRRKDRALVEYAAAEPVLANFPMFDDPISYRQLRYPVQRQEVVDFVKGLHPTPQRLNGIGVDKILNAELVEAALAAPNNAIERSLEKSPPSGAPTDYPD